MSDARRPSEDQIDPEPDGICEKCMGDKSAHIEGCPELCSAEATPDATCCEERAGGAPWHSENCPTRADEYVEPLDAGYLSALSAVRDNTCFVKVSCTLLNLRDRGLIVACDEDVDHRCGWRVTWAGNFVLANAQRRESVPSKYEVRHAWGHADCEDAERWDGAFATREEAIEDGIDTYNGESFWIVVGTYPDPASFVPSAERIIDEMVDNACSNVGEVADDYSGSNEAEETLDAFLEAWARKHMPCEFYLADGAKERIDPSPSSRDPKEGVGSQ